ncbi:MAG: glutamine--fructose-6-phosphate transaminase (isomerizing) [Mariprofundaceae bacterium]|nr:glutamine--fructose-6-phosphate transaminase (isomerizing) [Mariprofundaceae bacterium]
MCGIVGAVAQRNIASVLLEGLARLEYRGYDSAGISCIGSGAGMQRTRAMGKLNNLRQHLANNPCDGTVGIGHTRWATHGVPAEKNAHPHLCESFSVVHNGIIENHDLLRKKQLNHDFESQTDSEVIVHLLHDESAHGGSLLQTVQRSVSQLQGSYALAVICSEEPDTMVVARQGSPLVIGVADDAYYIASDILALLPVTKRFIYLEEGDTASLQHNAVVIMDVQGKRVNRAVVTSALNPEAVGKGEYRHFMLKEIYEQPKVIADTCEGRLMQDHVVDEILGPQAAWVLDGIKQIHVAACGTSYHAGLTARYWFEEIAGVSCRVEIASELRYRHPVVPTGTLLIVVSQSGETADTLAVLRNAKTMGYMATLAVCNVAESSMVRDADCALMTRAGPEIGVASTKAFTTQLVALMLLVIVIGRRFSLDSAREASLVEQLRNLPAKVKIALQHDPEIQALASHIADKNNALFLGRGTGYPVAMEGALKLKEVSYIHAEAYAAGELKHGPLALVDDAMPVIAVMPDDALLEKIKSNLAEVKARGGRLYVFSNHQNMVCDDQVTMIDIGVKPADLAPVVFTIPLQLLSYHVAVLRGTDVDQPRNLAKSVTVE